MLGENKGACENIKNMNGSLRDLNVNSYNVKNYLGLVAILKEAPVRRGASSSSQARALHLRCGGRYLSGRSALRFRMVHIRMIRTVHRPSTSQYVH